MLGRFDANEIDQSEQLSAIVGVKLLVMVKIDPATDASRNLRAGLPREQIGRIHTATIAADSLGSTNNTGRKRLKRACGRLSCRAV